MVPVCRKPTALAMNRQVALKARRSSRVGAFAGEAGFQSLSEPMGVGPSVGEDSDLLEETAGEEATGAEEDGATAHAGTSMANTDSGRAEPVGGAAANPFGTGTVGTVRRLSSSPRASSPAVRL